jgi:LacI family transcriptional regulator
VIVRREAFLRLSKELGFEVPTLNLPAVGADLEWGPVYEPFLRQAVIEWRATAVLTYSHFGAIALVRKAHDLGLTVPRDFSIVCFNNEPVLSLAIPSITAVDVPSVKMGQTAAELLLGQMNGKENDQPTSIKLTETLIRRESTTAPGQPFSRHPV